MPATFAATCCDARARTTASECKLGGRVDWLDGTPTPTPASCYMLFKCHVTYHSQQPCEAGVSSPSFCKCGNGAGEGLNYLIKVPEQEVAGLGFPPSCLALGTALQPLGHDGSGGGSCQWWSDSVLSQRPPSRRRRGRPQSGASWPHTLPSEALAARLCRLSFPPGPQAGPASR